MKIIADTHVHFYPCYDFKLWANSAFKNLRALESSSDCLKIIFLTERYDCNFFQELLLGKYNNQGYEVQNIDNSFVSLKESSSNDSLIIVPGRQIITAEKLEVLALGTNKKIEDKKPIREVISLLKDSTLRTVIPWSPGKWFFKRGKIIKQLLDQYKNEEITLADVISRPIAYPIPKLMKTAQSKGFKILAGSDPLPFAGEEKYVGTYCIKTSLSNSKNEDLKTMIKELFFSTQDLKIIGKRLNCLTVLLRLYKNQNQRLS